MLKSRVFERAPSRGPAASAGDMGYYSNRAIHRLLARISLWMQKCKGVGPRELPRSKGIRLAEILGGRAHPVALFQLWRADPAQRVTII